jgi:hypothetical protein
VPHKANIDESFTTIEERRPAQQDGKISFPVSRAIVLQNAAETAKVSPVFWNVSPVFWKVSSVFWKLGKPLPSFLESFPSFQKTWETKLDAFSGGKLRNGQTPLHCLSSTVTFALLSIACHVPCLFLTCRNFRHVENFDNKLDRCGLWNAHNRASSALQTMDFGWQVDWCHPHQPFCSTIKEKEEELKNLTGKTWCELLVLGGKTPQKISRWQTKMACFGTAAWSLVMMRRAINYKKGGEPHISMPPNQGETVLQNQELPRFLKAKMRWTITWVPSKREREPKTKFADKFLFQNASSCWSSGGAKKTFVPLPGEPVSDCVLQDASTCCDAAILLKVHGWMVLKPMTRMACVNLQCSHAKPVFLP